MPGLKTSLHLDMWREFKEKDSMARRVRRALRQVISPTEIYGLQWGDPEIFPPLQFLRDRWVLPYVNPQHVALEIGPGGGRWSRYLLDFRQLYVVDYHEEILNELKRNFYRPNMGFIKNNECDFPGVADTFIDYLFSFGCFVHLDRELIVAYLKNIVRILKPGGNAVLHYSDKSKIMAQVNSSFSDNTPQQMRKMVTESGFRILEEDLTTMWHSSLIRFTK